MHKTKQPSRNDPRAVQPIEVRRRRRTRRARVPALLAVAVLVAALLSACGSSGSSSIAHLKSSTSANSGTSTTKSRPSGIAFSRCMRSHGVPNFPDPTSSGGLSLTQSSGVNAQSPAFQTADRDCKSLSPAGTVTPAHRSKEVAASLKLAECMRTHGVPKFPDPTTSGASNPNAAAAIRTRTRLSSRRR